jgi:hypothetical protein
VKRDWRTVNVDSVPDTSRLLAAYVGKKGEHTIVGLDTAGAQLNALSAAQVSYTLGGLPTSQKFHLAVWNEAGDGVVGPSKIVTSDAAGVVTFVAPQHGVFALTSLRLP